VADPGVRIALVHALAHSIAPINAEFARAWPEARRMNLLDDSHRPTSPRAVGLDEHDRSLPRARQLRDRHGAAAILFTLGVRSASTRWRALARPAC
jgi:hypothetical protein